MRKADPVVSSATEEDIPRIAVLARRIWPVAYDGILTPAQINNMLELIYSHENLRREMEIGHRFWLAALDNERVGYASGYRENTDIIWIKKIYVEPALQGRGIGRALTRAVVKAFSPARELRLLANPHNVPAHRYYMAQGFAKIAEVPVKMGDWDFTDYLFAKPLADEII